jgi:elongation factor Ts
MSTVTITAADVNKLRQQTGAGMMDCKKALEETQGDFDAAVDLLRKKGQKVSELRAGRAAKEGKVVAKVSADGKVGVAVPLNSETDFVAKNDDFVSYADKFAEVALTSGANTLEELLAASLEGVTVADKVNDLVAKINEKNEISSFAKIEAETVVVYNHSNGKVSVVLGLNKPATDAIVQIGKDLAMQVAALAPVAVDSSEVDPEVIERELAIAKEQTLAEGKPADMVEKIAQGRVQKVLKDITLINQAFVKDGSKTVAQVLQSVDKDLKVTAFKRVSVA